MPPNIIAPADAPPEPALRCPLCDYDLRGLPEPRCPECGYGEASWDVLRQRIRTSHPWLFEHHPERNVDALLRTLVAGLNPWSFWRSVHPFHELRVGRLVRYWLTVNLIALAALAPLYAYSCNALHRFNAAQRPLVLARFRAQPKALGNALLTYGTIEAALDEWYPVAPRGRLFLRAYEDNIALRGAALVLRALVVWPWLVLLVMQVFRTTLRTAKIRPGHIARCAVYACDLAPWLVALPGLAWAAWSLAQPVPTPPVAWTPFPMSPMIAFVLAGASLGAFVITGLRLAVAYRRYLRLRHAVATAILVQVVALLALAAVGT